MNKNNIINKDYSAPWTQTFDIRFLVGWLLGAAGLTLLTIYYQPELFHEYGFFRFCGIKLLIMCLIGVAGGALCRHYCKVDSQGYIKENSHAYFKVNYTRKLQHFAAYLIPLLGPAAAPYGLLPHIWESLLVLLAFLLLIKPVREHMKFFMLQFNSMDRPEDRPNTLKWIVCGNLLPALILSTIFQQIYEDYLHEPKLALIVVLIVGIGDGLAEPVGIYLGKKKYTVPSWNMQQRYVRSYAGSACVFLSSLLFVGVFYAEFNTLPQFIAAMVLVPPVMTFAEAYAPHSMDTPVMMTLGFSLLALICIIL